MKRLHHTQTGVQILVPDDKAARLIADGTYKAAPDSEQPPKETTIPTPTTKAKRKPGRTDIASAIADLAGPQR